MVFCLSGGRSKSRFQSNARAAERVPRWVTEATPVSSVERKVIGLASAPWVEVGVVDSAEAVVDAVAVAGEVSGYWELRAG